MADESAQPIQQPDALPPASPSASPPIAAPSAAAAVNVIDPTTGELGSIPAEHLESAIAQGYQQATPEQVNAHFNEQEFGTPWQQAISGIEGIAKGVAGPLATGAERLLGISPRGIRGREEVNPYTHGIDEAAGLIALAVLTGGESLLGRATLGGAMEAAGSAGVKALGLEAAADAPAIARIGSAAAKGAIENMVFQGSDETSKMILQDPNQSAQTMLADVGLAAIIGGGVGAGFGAVSPLWEATKGSKLGRYLGKITDKLGGNEGIVSDDMQKAIDRTGIPMDPIAKARLSDDPWIQKTIGTLNQTDTNTTGLKVQAALRKADNDLGEGIVRTMGREPEAVKYMDLSEAEHGKNVGNALADEIKERMDPLSKEFEDLKSKYQGAELPQDQVISGGEMPDKVIPGVASQIADKIGHLANEQGWMSSPSSDIMKAVNNTLKELPRQKTLKDLGNFMTQVGNNTASTLPFGAQTPLSRSGSLIKNILRDAESEVAMQRLGSEAPDLVERYKMARDAYRQQSVMKDALNDRLHVGGSTSGFAKSVRTMAQTDSESLLRRLSGKGDADLLNILKANFPKTAEALSKYHVDSLLEKAASKARSGEDIINARNFVKSVDNMSPELRNFSISPEQQAKLRDYGMMLNHIDKIPHNFTNSGRVAANLLQGTTGSVVGMASLMLGHGPFASIITGQLGSLLAKDAPDAIKLAMIKFMGSDKAINATGFKSAVDMIHSTMKGENALSKATKNLFKAESQILPESMHPSESDRRKLDKGLKAAQTDPMGLAAKVDANSSHYMPEYGGALGQVLANASNFLNAKRPNNTVNAPLDTKIKPSPAALAEFNRTLNLAQQPLMVLEHIKKGNLTPQDVITVKTLYPDLYNRMSQKMIDGIADHVNKGDTVPYKTRLGLSMFLGMPLDSTMTPEGIMSAQPIPAQQPQQGQGSPNVKKTGNSLTKLPKSYQTKDQAMEARNMKD